MNTPMNLTMEYQLLPQLQDFGTLIKLSGNLQLNELCRGAQLFLLPAGIDYEVELSNTGEGILLRGKARCSATTECARCLEEATLSVEGDVECYYVLSNHQIEGDSLSDEFVLIGPEGRVDMTAPILAAIIYELPQVILCKNDCAGLCSKCGMNLNEGTCTCSEDIDPSNPFYALINLV